MTDPIDIHKDALYAVSRVHDWLNDLNVSLMRLGRIEPRLATEIDLDTTKKRLLQAAERLQEHIDWQEKETKRRQKAGKDVDELIRRARENAAQ